MSMSPKIVTLRIEHDPSGMCFVTSDVWPEFFLSTPDDAEAYQRMEAALAAFYLSRFGLKVTAEVAEEVGRETDFRNGDIAKFVASEFAQAA